MDPPKPFVTVSRGVSCCVQEGLNPLTNTAPCMGHDHDHSSPGIEGQGQVNVWPCYSRND